MITNHTPRYHHQYLICGTRCHITLISDIGQERGNSEQMHQMNPCSAGSCLPSDNKSPAMVHEEKDAQGKKGRIDPYWCIGSFEAHKQKERCDDQQVKYRQHKMLIHNRRRHDLYSCYRKSATALSPTRNSKRSRSFGSMSFFGPTNKVTTITARVPR